MKFTPQQKHQITRVINTSEVLTSDQKVIVLKEIEKAYLYKKCKKCNKNVSRLVKGKCRYCYDQDYKKTYVYRDGDFTIYLDPVTEEFKPFEVR